MTTVEGAEQVNLDRLLPLLKTGIFNVGILARNRRVVNQDIDGAETGERRLDHRIDAARVRDVSDDGECLAAHIVDHRGDLLDLRSGARRQGHPRTRARENLRGYFSDTPPGSGDYRHLAVQQAAEPHR